MRILVGLEQIGLASACLIFFYLFVAPPIHGQASNESQKNAPVNEETADDPLGRSTPRGTVLGFSRANAREDYDLAISYLDTRQKGELAHELVLQLETILDKKTSVDGSKLSDKPEGNLIDLKNPNRQLVAVVKTSWGSSEISLERVKRGDNPTIWLFSRQTLQLVPEIYEDMGNSSGLEQYLPNWLKTKMFFSVPLWRWVILLLSMPLVFFSGSLLVRLLNPPLKFFIERKTIRTDADLSKGLVPPLRLALLGVVFIVGANYSYTLMARHMSRNLGNVLVILGITWLSIKIVGITGNLILSGLKQSHMSDRIALAALLSRLIQLGCAILGILTLLYLAGVNLTATLAGLGIGGVAVAFAAQRTIENLFGGIMIISDQPVRIGDACRIAEVTGTVVDIGLRSTRIRTRERTIVTVPNGQLATMNVENYTFRDKFWFHPIIALSRDTTADQMKRILEQIEHLLEKNSTIEQGTNWVRFVDLGTTSQDVEIFAYVLTMDQNEFLRIQEESLLQLVEIVESAGAMLAIPTHITRVVHGEDSTFRVSKELKKNPDNALAKASSAD